MTLPEKARTIDVEALESPWPDELLRTRPGRGGDVTYVEAADYIRRMNAVFAGHWSFEIIDRHVADAEVVVTVSLSAAGETKQAFGVASIKVSDGKGSIPKDEILSIATDLKAAATDGLKKACTLFGIGLEHHSKSGVEQQRAQQRQKPQERQQQRKERRDQEQRVAAMRKAAREAGKDVAWLGSAVEAKYAKPLSAVTNEEADHIINGLEQMKRDAAAEKAAEQ